MVAAYPSTNWGIWAGKISTSSNGRDAKVEHEGKVPAR